MVLFYILAEMILVLRIVQFSFLYKSYFYYNKVFAVGQASVATKIFLGVAHAHNLQCLIIDLKRI